MWDHERNRTSDPAYGKIMPLRRICNRRFLLNVLRKDHAGHRALIECNSHSAIDTVANGSGVHCRDAVLAGDVLEQRRQVDFLLILAANGSCGGLANDRKYWLMVHLRVVQPIEKMYRARPACCEAYTNCSGELGMRAGHESSQLFMSRLDKPRLVVV